MILDHEMIIVPFTTENQVNFIHLFSWICDFLDRLCFKSKMFVCIRFSCPFLVTPSKKVPTE